MGRVPEFNEGDSFTANFKFFDKDFVPSSPLTLRYRIDDLTNKVAVRDWTEVPAFQEVDIDVTPEDNAIQNTNNVRERKQIVAQSNFGTSTQKSETKEWDVRNVQGIT